MCRTDQDKYQRYDTLLEHFGGHIRLFCFGRAHSEDEARALVQEVLVALWDAIGSLRAGIPTPMANVWLHRVMRSAVAKYMRRSSAAAGQAAADSMPAEDDASRQAADAIADLAVYLAHDERELLDDYLSGYSYDEMAAARGIATGTLRTRMHRIKKKLKTIKTKLYGQ